VKSGSANLSDINRKEAFLRDRTTYSRLRGGLRNASELLFYLSEAIVKVLSVRYIDGLGSNRPSFRDNFAV
jgi:hypothetical protein